MACVGVDEPEDASPFRTDVVPNPPHVGRRRQWTVHVFRTPRSGRVAKVPVNTVSNWLASSVESIAHGVESGKVGCFVRLLMPAPIVFHKCNVPTCVFVRVQHLVSQGTRETLARLMSVGSINTQVDAPAMRGRYQNESYSNN